MSALYASYDENVLTSETYGRFNPRIYEPAIFSNSPWARAAIAKAKAPSFSVSSGFWHAWPPPDAVPADCEMLNVRTEYAARA